MSKPVELEIEVDLKILNECADSVIYGPQSSHAQIRHSALMACKKAFIEGHAAGYKNGLAVGKVAQETAQSTQAQEK